MMLPEQLLQPRYKVIADMPFKPSQHMYNVGDILTDNGKTAVLDQNGDPVFPCEWEKYPHIFRPLEWWEERKAEDMPGYVKYAENGFIAKVDHFDLETTSAWFMYLEGGAHPYSPGGSVLENTHWLPATEAEYLEYIKTKA